MRAQHESSYNRTTSTASHAWYQHNELVDEVDTLVMFAGIRSQVLAADEKRLGPHHPDVAADLLGLGELLTQQVCTPNPCVLQRAFFLRPQSR